LFLTPLGRTGETLAVGLSALRGLHGALEGAFLELGDHLGNAHRKSQHLMVMARALAERLNEAEFLDTVAGLETSLNQVNALRRDDTDSGCLTDIAQAAMGVRKQLQTLLKIMGQLSMLGINAKIEAAQVSVGNIDFTLFTHEIHHLSKAGHSGVTDVLSELQALSQALGRAISERGRLAAQQAEELGELVDRLATSIRAVRTRQQEATQAMVRLPEVLEGTAASIGTAVMGLQFGDIIRQRLEHVETALTVLTGILGGDDVELADTFRAASPPALVAAICELEIHQLSDIEGEFRRNSGAALDGLHKVATAIDNIRVITEKVYSSGIDGGSTFLMDIDKDLERAAAIMQHYAEVTETTRACLTEVNGRVAAMKRTMNVVREVDAEMNLIGLNASIKCGNIGSRGRALNVIAHELRASARQTRTTAEDIAAKLGVIVDQTGALTTADAGDGVQGLRQSLCDAAERLRHSGGETAWVMSQIQGDAQMVVEHVSRATGRFDIGEQMRQTVAGVIDDLRTLVDAMSSRTTAEDVAAARDCFLSFMQSHYTMDVERLIHHGAKPPAQPQAADADDLSDIFF
jgi:hypothetical protein